MTLPFSVKSVVDDILGPATSRVTQITSRGSGLPSGREASYTKLHLAVTAIDRVPLKSAGGCPVNAEPLKTSQAGNAEPSARRAV